MLRYSHWTQHTHSVFILVCYTCSALILFIYSNLFLHSVYEFSLPQILCYARVQGSTRELQVKIVADLSMLTTNHLLLIPNLHCDNFNFFPIHF